MDTRAKDVLEFWVGLGPKKWWRRDDAVDAEIRSRFGELYLEAASGRLDAWLEEPDSALALVIVLDQFSRNMYRNDPRAFAQDTRCAHLVLGLIEAGLDRRMRTDIGVFCYLPLMHAENIHDQRLCLAEMERLELPENVEAAQEHLDIIERFGRFPHRNVVLNRQTTEAEQAFLDGGGFSG